MLVTAEGQDTGVDGSGQKPQPSWESTWEQESGWINFHKGQHNFMVSTYKSNSPMHSFLREKAIPFLKTRNSASV